MRYVAILLFLLAVRESAALYKANMINTPLISKRGDIVASRSFSGSNHLTFSPLNNYGVMINYHHRYISSTNNDTEIEFGIGYYRPLTLEKTDLNIEFYIGYGNCIINRGISDPYISINNLECSFDKFFIQCNAGKLREQGLEMAAATRLVYVKYPKVTLIDRYYGLGKYPLFFEFAATAKVGPEFAKLFFQFGTIIKINNNSLDYWNRRSEHGNVTGVLGIEVKGVIPFLN